MPNVVFLKGFLTNVTKKTISAIFKDEPIGGKS